MFHDDFADDVAHHLLDLAIDSVIESHVVDACFSVVDVSIAFDTPS